MTCTSSISYQDWPSSEPRFRCTKDMTQRHMTCTSSISYQDWPSSEPRFRCTKDMTQRHITCTSSISYQEWPSSEPRFWCTEGRISIAHPPSFKEKWVSKLTSCQFNVRWFVIMLKLWTNHGNIVYFNMHKPMNKSWQYSLLQHAQTNEQIMAI